MNRPQLLSRDDFREGVFARDKNVCVVCKQQAENAHHIIERRLWSDGGYYLDNGASVCGNCHLDCERTDISVEQIREFAGIKNIVLPEDMYPDFVYDKWGNVLNMNGTRTRGPLFQDASVRKVLAAHLHEFTYYAKYPRTFHLPWSSGATKDDRVLSDTKHFEGKNVVVTVKMDGENTSMYSDYIHARSLEYASHPSRDYVKRIWGNKVAGQIPEGWRICGENLFAKHSIKYEHLSDYFLMFSIWGEKNVCLSDHETRIWSGMLGIPMVPTMWFGLWNEGYVKNKMLDEFKEFYSHTDVSDEIEGYVVRLAYSFEYKDYSKSVAKFVRENHVTTGSHWMHEKIEKNTLHADWKKGILSAK